MLDFQFQPADDMKPRGAQLEDSIYLSWLVVTQDKLCNVLMKKQQQNDKMFHSINSLKIGSKSCDSGFTYSCVYASYILCPWQLPELIDLPCLTLFFSDL